MNEMCGTHGLLDLHHCANIHLLSDAQALHTLLLHAAEAAGATVVFAHFHTFGGHGGVTGVLLLAESHISIHTWPENAFVAADVFLCGSLRLQAARMVLQEALQAQRVKWTVLQRGYLDISP